MRGRRVGRADVPISSPASSIFGTGYSDDVARKAVRPFLRSKDPRLGMLRRFAAAAELPIEELIVGPKAGKRKK